VQVDEERELGHQNSFLVSFSSASHNIDGLFSFALLNFSVLAYDVKE
jgi:hypothetical protein